MDIVRDMSDLQYINERLLESGFVHTKFNAVKRRKARMLKSDLDHLSPCSASIESVDSSEDTSTSGFLDVGISKPRTSTSPDSDILCDSPECPIKNIQHNIGRYFHNGCKPPQPPKNTAFEWNIIGSTEDIDNTFNRTVPPPMIVTAYIKVCLGIHTDTDSEMVRQYKKHHMWPLTVSEPVTPYLRDEFPHMHGLHGQVILSESEEDCEGSILTPQSSELEFENDQDDPVSDLIEEGLASRPLRASDFEDSDDESTSHCGVIDDEYFTPEQSAEADREIATSDYESNVTSSPTREVPQGDQLLSDRLRIQEKMLQRMAKDQRLLQAQNRTSYGNVHRSQRTSRHYPNDDDIALEILLELLELLPTMLHDRNLHSIFPNHKHMHKHGQLSDSEYAILCDVQIMLKRCFADIIAHAERPYQPTGLPITTAQLCTELVSVISRQQDLLALYPGKSIADIVEKFSREGKDLLCE